MEFARNMHKLLKPEELSEHAAQRQHAIIEKQLPVLISQCKQLWNIFQQLDMDIGNIQNEQSQFVFDLEEKRHFSSAENHKQEFDRWLLEKFHALLKKRLQVHKNFQNFLNQLNYVLALLVKLLNGWQLRQKLKGNGPHDSQDLDLLQNGCESLFDIIWSSRHQLHLLRQLEQNQPVNYDDNSNNRTSELECQLTLALSSLVSAAFIVEIQPPQVLKKNTKFASRVRLLIGAKLSLSNNPPRVEVSIMNEENIQSLQKNGLTCPEASARKLLNGSKIMDVNKQGLNVSFRDLQLQSIVRSKKESGDGINDKKNVTDQKSAILFQSTFKINDVTFCVWTLSLPVVVVVHGNQETQAMATVCWDNAFSEPNRVPFQVPQFVTWKQLAEMLASVFKINCGKGLEQDALVYLKEKLFGTNVDDSVMCRWTQFCKDHLRNYRFTFWDWFYSILKLTREHLREMWCDNLIMGFVTREKASHFLRGKVQKSFLLRFSDSVLGSVVVTYIKDNGEAGNVVITLHELASLGLANRIVHETQFEFLHGDVPKIGTFDRYCKKSCISSSSSDTGYSRQVLIAKIDGASENGDISSPQNSVSPDSVDLLRAPLSSGLELNTSVDYDEFFDPETSLICSDVDMRYIFEDEVLFSPLHH